MIGHEDNFDFLERTCWLEKTSKRGFNGTTAAYYKAKFYTGPDIKGIKLHIYTDLTHRSRYRHYQPARYGIK